MNPQLIATLVILVIAMALFLSERLSLNLGMMLARLAFRAADSAMNSV